MWNVPHWAEITLYVLIPVVMVAFLAGVVWRVRKWFLGQAEPGTPSVWQQLRQALRPRRLAEFVETALLPIAALARRLRPGHAPGDLLGHGRAVRRHRAGHRSTRTSPICCSTSRSSAAAFYRLFELALDVFGVVLILGVAMAAYRRYVVRPERLQPTRTRGQPVGRVSRSSRVLLLIAVTGFVVEGLRIAEGFHIEAQVRRAPAAGGEEPAVLEQLGLRERFHMGSAAAGRRIAAASPRAGRSSPPPPGRRWATRWPRSSRRCRSTRFAFASGRSGGCTRLLAFGLIVGIPFTKAFHLISSPANMLLRDAGPAGPAAGGGGIGRAHRARLHLAATAAGRRLHLVRQVPGGLSGLQHAAFRSRRATWSRPSTRNSCARAAKANGETPSLHGASIRPEELWACCTCRACEEVCPVHVQHPRLIIDLRRHLVDQGQVDEGLQDALMNFQRYGNSFGQSPRKRADWTKPLDFKLKDARKEEVEYLWFVGDYASYDQRAQEVTRTIARVLQHAGRRRGAAVREGAERGQRRAADRRGRPVRACCARRTAKELAGAKFRTPAHHRPAHVQHAEERIPGRRTRRRRGRGHRGARCASRCSTTRSCSTN